MALVKARHQGGLPERRLEMKRGAWTMFNHPESVRGIYRAMKRVFR